MSHPRASSPLALARRARGLSQTKAAEALGLKGGRMALSPYEVGRELVLPGLLERMESLYGMDHRSAMSAAVATFRHGLTLTRYREMAEEQKILVALDEVRS